MVFGTVETSNDNTTLLSKLNAFLMSKFPPPKPLGRRVLSVNVPLPSDARGKQAEPAVSVSISDVAGESSLGGAAIRASVGRHLSLPVVQTIGVGAPEVGILSETEGKKGVCVTINDLAPGESVPMVGM